MRLTVFPVNESDLRCDFSAAIWCDKHDESNTVFDGVDFIIKESNRQVWLEVKNWEGSSVPARRRGGQRRRFLAKLNSKVFFREELRGKFVGTCSYLALTNNTPQEDIVYLALLESPRMDSALMTRATDKLKGLVKRDRIWHFVDSSGRRNPIVVTAAVMNLSEWNSRFPHYPVSAI